MNPCTNQWQSASNHYVICVTLRCKIISEIQLIENKEVTLMVQLNR